MPTPLQRTETLIRYPFRPPITITEYYAKLESLAPGCDSHELDVQLTAFCMRFKLELSTRGIRSYSNNRSNTVHSTKPMVYKLLDNTNESNSSKSLVPKWMFDPDESHDKLHHLLRFKCHVDIPQDDSCWARAYRSSHGLHSLLSQIHEKKKRSSIEPPRTG